MALNCNWDFQKELAMAFRTLDLAKEFYQLTRDLKLSAHLKDQFLRSASSVALNLAEGNAKRSEREKLRFYEIAHGSFRESLTILELENAADSKILELADHLGASLFKLTRALDEKSSKIK
jgi:four helix bundle protein